MYSHTLSPLDSRYASKTAELLPYFSDMALNRYRIKVEIEWLIMLSETEGTDFFRRLGSDSKKELRDVYTNFQEVDYEKLREIERETNHDVKAVEYLIRRSLTETCRDSVAEWIHFACTSEDINNLAYALMLKDAQHTVILPSMRAIINRLGDMAERYRSDAMLSRTHGQPASPTTAGKELYNVHTRLRRQYTFLRNFTFPAKINGAVGNFNAHVAVYPEVNWPQTAADFVTRLGLEWNPATTQIEPHDGLAEYLHGMIRFNTVLIDLCRDMWGYISLGYFSQKTDSSHTGSSTMPHKVNPIDFENAEGNLGIANSLAAHLAEKLPVSRWQRDLSDSTVIRNLGVIFGYFLLATKSLTAGLEKVALNRSIISAELSSHPEVLGEAIQTQLRSLDIPNSYEKLKTLTRGNTVTAKLLEQFIQSLDIPPAIKQKLLRLTPENYTGLAASFPTVTPVD